MGEKLQEHDTGLGLVCGLTCYGIWGVSPLYWNLLRDVSPFEIMINRMLWCAVTMGIVVLIAGKWRAAMTAFTTRRVVLTLFATAVLISVNWAIYIWSVESRQLVEASLGYFINPLVVLVMGVFLLGEKMSPSRWLSVALGIFAVGVQTYALGHFPWIAVVLGVDFAIYGYLRKIVRAGAMEGLFVESALC